VDQIFLVDYFLFTLLTSFGIVLISIVENPASKLNFLRKTKVSRSWGWLLIGLAYLWFFGSKNRSVHTVIEGAQLFFIFAFSGIAVIIISKLLAKLRLG